MKYLILMMVFAAGSFPAFSQAAHPVSWTYETQGGGADVFTLVIKAEIKEPWHIYPQKTSGGALGMPTEITFEENSNVELIGEIEARAEGKENKPNAPYFSKAAVFTQKLRLKSKAETNLNFKIRYMACTNAMCLPPSSKQFTAVFTEKDIKRNK